MNIARVKKMNKDKLAVYDFNKFTLKQHFFGIIIFMLSTQFVFAGSHPNMFLNQVEVDAIKVKVNAGVEFWASAHLEMMSLANIELDRLQPLESVTFQGRTDSQYYTESPHCGWSSPPNGCINGQ